MTISRAPLPAAIGPARPALMSGRANAKMISASAARRTISSSQL
jgi:hypothetical protein